MKLYYSKGACSLAVRILINEIGLKAEYESVNLKTKKTETDKDFLTINPKGSVPTLVLDNGHILTENVIIQEYLADTTKAYQLLPEVPNEARYHILEWANFITTELHKGFSPLFNPQFPDEIKEKIIKPNIHRKFQLVDKQLEKNKFIASNEFTLPDGYLFVILTWARNMKIDMDSFPNIVRYYDMMNERDSVKKSLKEEGFI